MSEDFYLDAFWEDHLSGGFAADESHYDNCEDCDCGFEDCEDCEDFYDNDYDSMDGDFDSGMRDAGYGTDEDYGYYGDYGDEAA